MILVQSSNWKWPKRVAPSRSRFLITFRTGFYFALCNPYGNGIYSSTSTLSGSYVRHLSAPVPGFTSMGSQTWQIPPFRSQYDNSANARDALISGYHPIECRATVTRTRADSHLSGSRRERTRCHLGQRMSAFLNSRVLSWLCFRTTSVENALKGPSTRCGRYLLALGQYPRRGPNRPYAKRYWVIRNGLFHQRCVPKDDTAVSHIAAMYMSQNRQPVIFSRRDHTRHPGKVLLGFDIGTPDRRRWNSYQRPSGQISLVVHDII